MIFKAVFLAILCGISWSYSEASELWLRLGPASVGNGGPNPLSIPPTNPIDYEVTYITQNKNELRFSISPGFFYGWRSELSNGIYVSAGPGLVINANGGAFGVYTAFGYQNCHQLCIGIEYLQALGISLENSRSPYALRLGLGYAF